MKDKKADIFNSGREEFSAKGFKGANVSTIAKLAGVGAGTFYIYYPSKAKLFCEIFIKENVKLKSDLVRSINPDEDPASVLMQLVIRYIDTISSNLILKEWYSRELFGRLEQYFCEQNGIQSIGELMYQGEAGLIKKWKNEGKIRNDINDELIVSIFNSIVYIDIHKAELGTRYFPKILFYITEFIMKGVTNFYERNYYLRH